MLRSLLTCLTILGFYGAAYRMLVARWGGPANWIAHRTHFDRTHPVRQVEAVSKLIAAGIAQLLFAIVLTFLTGQAPWHLLFTTQSLPLLPIGAIIGVGELALASMLGSTLMLSWSSLTTSHPTTRWLTESRGGWMAQFQAVVTEVPPWLAIVSITLYIAVEELIFRGILISALRPYGATIAIGVALVLFVSIQAFHMPSLRGASMPIAGATIVGTIHGLLFWMIPFLFPLIIAHLTFFSGTLLITEGKFASEQRARW